MKRALVSEQWESSISKEEKSKQESDGWRIVEKQLIS